MKEKEIEDPLDKTRRENIINNRRIIKEHLCKKCGGVKVNSFSTNFMAMMHGKRCNCK